MKMNEKNYKKKIEFQRKVASRQSEQIEELKLKIQELELKLEEKDRVIHSVDCLRQELKQNVDDVKKYKKEYRALIDELRKMKEIMNREVFKGKWKLIRFLMK